MALNSVASISGLDPLDINSNVEIIVNGVTRCAKVLFSTRSLYLAAQVPRLLDLQVQWMQGTWEFIGHGQEVGQALVVKQDLAVCRQAGILVLSHLS
ncbi:hypothetical protein LI328DRAFT_142789 [Trichoderma asperelloides]|nr:hypothetical protein LI328DRAFT_142789 [Trichoderma asperelloides]